MNVLTPARGASVAIMLLAAVSGCGPTPDRANANATAPATEPPLASVAPTSAAATPAGTIAATAAASGAPGCPATLTAGVTMPAGGILLNGPVRSALPLTYAIVTQDAATTITPKLDGLAELMPDEGEDREDLSTATFTATPSADRPHALLCQYGKMVPGTPQTALAVPLTAGTTWRCVTHTADEKTTATCAAAN